MSVSVELDIFEKVKVIYFFKCEIAIKGQNLKLSNASKMYKEIFKSSK